MGWRPLCEILNTPLLKVYALVFGCSVQFLHNHNMKHYNNENDYNDY